MFSTYWNLPAQNVSNISHLEHISNAWLKVVIQCHAFPFEIDPVQWTQVSKGVQFFPLETGR